MTEVEIQQLIDDAAATITLLSGYMQQAETEGIAFEVQYTTSNINQAPTRATTYISSLSLQAVKQLKTLTVTPSLS